MNTAENTTVSELVAQARSGTRWHDAVIQLVAHWIGRGWTDAEISAQAEGLTLTGYTVEGTRAELRTMVEQARFKWAMPASAEWGRA